jgi:hypothetical protein
MLRPAAMKAIVDSERIAGLLARVIPAHPALLFDEKSVQDMDGRYFLIYPWVDGNALSLLKSEFFIQRK